MSIKNICEQRKNEFNGTILSENGKKILLDSLPKDLIPEWFISILQEFPLINVNFVLSEEDDESEMEVDMRWLDASGIVSEAIEAYPGKLVNNLGYLPIGSCLQGSGDPYFLKISGNTDPAVFRILHDEIDGDHIEDSAFERVSSSLSKFFEIAEIHR